MKVHFFILEAVSILLQFLCNYIRIDII